MTSLSLPKKGTVVNIRFLHSIQIILLTCSTVFAQFNENLERDILQIGKKYKLDGIDKSEALDRLEEITPEIDGQEKRKHLVGAQWKYSHSVSNTGRKYRQSNAIYLFSFDENGNGYFLDSDRSKTWITWDDERSSFFEIDRYSSNKREKRDRRDYMAIHFITNDRLVLTKVVRSKTQDGKSAILFVVYFRR